jgi:hypothetical protein
VSKFYNSVDPTPVHEKWRRIGIISLVINGLLLAALGLGRNAVTEGKKSVPEAPARKEKAVTLVVPPSGARRIGPGGQPALNSYSIPVKLLDQLPVIVLSSDEGLNELLAHALDLDTAALSGINAALKKFIARARACEKDHAKLCTDKEGGTFLSVTAFKTELRSDRAELESQVAALLPSDKADLLNHLLDRSDELQFGEHSQELSFTEINNRQTFRRTYTDTDPPAVIDYYLDASEFQSSFLAQKFGHLLDTNAIIRNLQPEITKSREKLEQLMKTLSSGEQAPNPSK